MLVFVHYQNFFKNVTTNERFAKNIKIEENEESQTGSFMKNDQSALLNCLEMCCNTKKHRRISCEIRPLEEDSVMYQDVIKNYEGSAHQSVLSNRQSLLDSHHSNILI
mmetsp:Transcript_9317/g.9320  ORF Transcript_9317/g.9320 Transcript_9317/m.9320 type:complete len:108 (+) Transcript_9317:319-642(+)